VSRFLNFLEPFIFAVEKDYKKEVIAEYDVQAGTL